MKNLTTIFVTVVVLAAAVVGLSLWWDQKTSNPAANLAAVGDALPVAEPTEPEPVLALDPQFPGRVVYVSLIKVPAGAWVAVHKSTADGVPGEIMGVGFFPPGVEQGIIDLSEDTVEGDNYYAVLYRDSGDEQFNTADDSPWLTTTGSPLILSFPVTRNLPESKG